MTIKLWEVKYTDRNHEVLCTGPCWHNAESPLAALPIFANFPPEIVTSTSPVPGIPGRWGYNPLLMWDSGGPTMVSFVGSFTPWGPGGIHHHSHRREHGHNTGGVGQDLFARGILQSLDASCTARPVIYTGSSTVSLEPLCPSKGSRIPRGFLIPV